MRRALRAVPALAAVLATAALPSPASAAVETEGTGVNMTHLRNIQFPHFDEGAASQGTDLEFATITVPGPAAVIAPVAPLSVPAALRPTGKPAVKKRRTTVPRKCRRYKAGSKRRAACVKAERRKAARRRAAAKRRAARRDAAPATPGLQRTFAFVGSYDDGLQVIDITDPRDARLVATYDCGLGQGDVQVFQRPDLGNRWFATFTADDGYSFRSDSQCAKEVEALGFDVSTEGKAAGTFILEVTDPYHPTSIAHVPFAQGSHNMTVHPSGKWLYNSNSDLITSPLPAIEIADISDIFKPKVVSEFALKPVPGLGTESHDITFNADGSRAYVAAISHGEILDTTDPAKPTAISSIIDPTINVWHEMVPVHLVDPALGERDFLIAEDEFAGATPTGQCPNGGVHVYDVTGDLEAAPVPVGYWNIGDIGPTSAQLGGCTAHVFQVFPKEQLMTIAFYNGGVRVVDLSALVGVALGGDGVGMKELGSFVFPDSNAWAVKAPTASRGGFFLFADDHSRGFDVYEYKPSAAGARRAAASSRWLTPAQAKAEFARTVRSGAIRVAGLCLLGAQQRAGLL